ncbi:MAG: hypothetical protein L6R19_13765, partial [Alphaproteobacteria bacterium]|nr:hypothetical protein [Alphaproteobacteria bacterium]
MPPGYVAEARVLVGLAEPVVVSAESIVADIGPDEQRVQNEALVVHPAESSADIARLAKRVEVVAPWKGDRYKQQALDRVVDSFAAHAPAATQVPRSPSSGR